MAADLHIHVFQGIDEDDLRIFSSNHIGSKYDFMTPIVEKYHTGDGPQDGMDQRTKDQMLQELQQAEAAFDAFQAEYARTHKRSKSLQALYDRLNTHDDPRVLAYDRVSQTPNIWIGEVSWLKAGLFDDPDAFIPNAVGTIYDLIGEDLPVLDSELRSAILAALSLPNETQYSLANKQKVARFLTRHMGKQLFTVSW